MKIKKYNKLVRDKIPEICLKKGVMPKVKIAKNKKEYLIYLQKKILEEASEITKKTKIKELKEEIADLVEVTNCLIKTLGISKKEIEKIRKHKNRERGGFKKRLILMETIEK
jgi:predicted house-cleaning noncanonical NTP pyrophosphatase (MazG superfamily)